MTSPKDRARRAGAAMVGAAIVAAGPALAQPSPMPNVPTTRILAVGRATPKFTPAVLQTVMPEEVRETVKLYLQGKVGDWYMRKDRPGVVFVFNTTDPKEAQHLLDALPFGRDGLMDFDLIPLGPLAPLGLLLNPAAG
jgi:hypothetical protein